jgi:hypothetical protein
MSKLALLLMLVCAFAVPARAESPSREAGAHFQRGVDLYNDGDYRGALVEFKKAYAIWPRANVLYDVGQTEFQLLDYASALKTMERYLAETGPNAAHRQEVENTVEILRGRVGRIALATSVPDCDVFIDEQPVGATPLNQSVLVAVGTRNVSVRCPGRAPVSRAVEVAAGETVRLDPKVPAPTTASTAAIQAAITPPRAHEPTQLPTRTSMAIGWTFSAVLAAATIGVGSATLVEQSKLESMKNTYPTNKAQLDSQGNMTLGLSIASDALAVASLVAIGVSTYFTVKLHKEQHTKLRLGMSGTGMSLAGNF